MPPAASITLDTQYVLKALETKLAIVQYEQDKYKKEYDQYVQDLKTFERNLIIAFLQNASINNFEVYYSDRFYTNEPLHISIGTRNNHNINIVPEQFGLSRPVKPRNDYDEYSRSELEQMISLLKACATPTINSKMIGNVGRYL